MPDAEVIVAAIGLFFVASFGRLLARSWLCPGPFFTVIWSFIVLLSLSAPLFGVPRYPIWHGSIWWIALQCTFLIVGDLVGQGLARRAVARDPDDHVLLPHKGLFFPTTIVVLCTTCTFVYMYTWDGIVGRGQEPPTTLQTILALHYVGALFGGMLFAAATSVGIRALALLIFIPGLVFSLFGAGRTVVVAHFTFWFAGYFSMLLYVKARRVPLFTKGRLAAAAACLTVFFFVGLVVSPFRSVPRGVSTSDRVEAYAEILDDENTMDSSWEFMKPNFFGHISMFSTYFEQAWERPLQPRAFGARTLNGPIRLLGIQQADDYRMRIADQDTNVFTIFGPLIMDYSLVGSCLIFLVIGVVAGWAYEQVLNGSLWQIGILLAFYTNSMIAGGWYFNYNSVVVSYVLTSLYLLWFQSRMKQGKHQMGDVGYVSRTATES